MSLQDFTNKGLGYTIHSVHKPAAGQAQNGDEFHIYVRGADSVALEYVADKSNIAAYESSWNRSTAQFDPGSGQIVGKLLDGREFSITLEPVPGKRPRIHVAVAPLQAGGKTDRLREDEDGQWSGSGNNPP